MTKLGKNTVMMIKIWSFFLNTIFTQESDKFSDILLPVPFLVDVANIKADESSVEGDISTGTLASDDVDLTFLGNYIC